MNDKLLQAILDIGQAMLESGAEINRVEDSVERMCLGYGCRRCDIYSIPNNMQLTVESEDGKIFTQIRNVRKSATDFDRLDQLNALSRSVVSDRPDEETITKKLEMIGRRKETGTALTFFSAMVASGSFTVFFGGNVRDALVAMVVGFVVIWMEKKLHQIENNIFTFNFVISAVIAFIALISVKTGIGSSSRHIIIGSIMLVISALGLTNGIREVLHSNIISGIIRVVNACLGALGIAAGTWITMLILSQGTEVRHNTGAVTQLVSLTVGCVAFSMMVGIHGRKLFFAGTGAFLTWIVMIAVNSAAHSVFLSTLAASVFVTLYAELMARVNRAPATIFLTLTAYPLIPGASFYDMMYYLVKLQYREAGEQALITLAVAVGIAFGFIIGGIIYKYIQHTVSFVRRKRRQKERTEFAREIRNQRKKLRDRRSKGH